MPTDAERIAALEARLTAAEARIAVLEQRPYLIMPTPSYVPPQQWPNPWYPTWICGTITPPYPDLRQVNAAGTQP